MGARSVLLMRIRYKVDSEGKRVKDECPYLIEGTTHTRHASELEAFITNAVDDGDIVRALCTVH